MTGTPKTTTSPSDARDDFLERLEVDAKRQYRGALEHLAGSTTGVGSVLDPMTVAIARHGVDAPLTVVDQNA